MILMQLYVLNTLLKSVLYDMNFEGGVVFADDEIFTLGTDLYLDKTFKHWPRLYRLNGEDDTFSNSCYKNSLTNKSA